jgi:hypothetical protein
MAELLLCGRDEGDVRSLEAADRLERNVDARAVVEAAGRDPATGELDRFAHQHHRIPGRHERPRLGPVLRTDVDVELVPLDLLVVLHLPRDHTADDCGSGVDLHALAVRDARAHAAELVHREEPVVRDVRDREADHVQVREEGEERALAAPPHDEIPHRVGLDLCRVPHRPSHRVERELLVPGGAVRAQERVECLRQRHGAGSLWRCRSRPTC